MARSWWPCYRATWANSEEHADFSTIDSIRAPGTFMNGNNGNASGTKRPANDPMNDLRLAAARKRLSESRGQEDALEGLREIVANFLGSEEMGLFRVDRGSARFEVFWSFGIDSE